MKKVLLMAVLFCIVSIPGVMAQSHDKVPPKSDPAYSQSKSVRDHQMIKKEADRKNNPVPRTEPSKTHMATPARVKTADNEREYKKEMKEENKAQPQTLIKKSTGVTPAQEAKTLKQDLGNNDRKARKYQKAKWRMEQAKAKLEYTQRAMEELIKSQAVEKKQLEERFAQESANGLTDDMRLRQDDERRKMDNRHSCELMDAQKAVNKAMRRYNKAESLVNETPN